MNGIGKKPREDAIPIMYPLTAAMIAVPINIANRVGGGLRSDIAYEVEELNVRGLNVGVELDTEDAVKSRIVQRNFGD